MVFRQNQTDRTLYLAIPSYSYEGIFSKPLGQLAIEEMQLRLIVFDENEQRILRWI